MGGFGSGRRSDSKRRVEESISLDTSWMLQNSYFDLGVGQRGHHTITWKTYHGELRYILAAGLERLFLYLINTQNGLYIREPWIAFDTWLKREEPRDI